MGVVQHRRGSGDVDDGLTTLRLVVQGNLGVYADFSTTPITSGTHDLNSGSGSTLEYVTADSDLWATATVVDSAGTDHTLTLISELTGTSDWSYWLLAYPKPSVHTDRSTGQSHP